MTRAVRPLLLAAVPAVLLLTFLAPTVAGAGAIPPDRIAASSDPPLSPPATIKMAAADDVADGEVVMFGGEVGWPDDEVVLGTTWTYSGGNWTNETPDLAIQPPARFDAAMAYDPLADEAIMFGGCGSLACSTPLGDTWAFHDGAWRDLTPTLNASPPAAFGSAMAWDGGAGAILLFGGSTSATANTFSNETWEFTAAGGWRPVDDAPGAPTPSARDEASFGYDPAANETVLFGGATAPGIVGDTWAFSNGTWKDLTATLTPAPSARHLAGMTYDASDGELLLFGGYYEGSYYDDLWEFTPTAWVHLTPSGSVPSTRFGGLFTYDAADGYVLIFGGAAQSDGAAAPSAQTYSYVGGSFTLRINPSPSTSFLEEFLPLLLLPVVLGVALTVGLLTRRRRERLYGSRFDIPPTEALTWVPTPDWKATARRMPLILAAVVLVAGIIPLLAIGATTPGGWSSVAPIALFLAVFLGMYIAVIAYVSYSTAVRAIAATSAGVIVKRGRGETRIPWAEIQPSITRPERSGKYTFEYLVPARGSMRGFLGLTVDQSRAVLTHPSAPAWNVPPALAAAVGLPATVGPALVAPAQRFGGARTPGAPLSSGAVGRYGPPPPPPPPPPAAPPSAPIRRCPACGQLSTAYGPATCPRCGQLLP